MTTPDLKLLSHVNASGYPFQLRIEHEIRKSEQRHGWRVMASEFPWRHRTTDEFGFADLVLEKFNWFLVVECKRLREAGTYIFLRPGLAENVSRITAHFAVTAPRHALGWGTMAGLPPSAEAAYCVIPGTGPKDKPIIERLAAELVAATEAVAREQYDLRASDPAGGLNLFLPMIVTNATLYVAEYDPDAVSLDQGELRDGAFREVAMVRFRKGLSTERFAFSGFAELNQVHDKRQRTVLVVNANHLVEVLEAWQFTKLFGHMPWPWEAAVP